MRIAGHSRGPPVVAMAALVLRCQRTQVVASVAMPPCDKRPVSTEHVLVDGLDGTLGVVAGARDHCNYFRYDRLAGNHVLVQRYPTCPAGYTLATDADTNWRGLCIKTALAWVAPLAAPH